MKIVHRNFIRNGPGIVKLFRIVWGSFQFLRMLDLSVAQMVPDEDDDLWIAYNLIAEGDSVLATTVRKVFREAASGGRDAERVKLKLEIKVENVEFDKEGGVLQIRGKNVLENEHVKIGAFHTIELELHRPFVLKKDVWDSLALDMLHQAADPAASADLAVILMQEGLAHIFLIGKRHSLKEVLDAPNVMNLIKDTKAAQEVRALKEFFDMLSNDSSRACYGPKHVEFAHERMAIQTLLVTDELFRNADITTRKRYVDLVSSVKGSSGNAFIFSSMHVSGEQLAQLTGIAAILRFPLLNLEDLEM